MPLNTVSEEIIGIIHLEEECAQTLDAGELFFHTNSLKLSVYAHRAYKSHQLQSLNSFLKLVVRGMATCKENSVANQNDEIDSTNSMLPIGNPGHTMSDDSSQESEKENVQRKVRRVRKIVVEKRPRSSSSSSSSLTSSSELKTGASKKTKVQDDDDFRAYDFSDAADYPNPMGHPKVQSLMRKEIYGDESNTEGLKLKIFTIM